jgi:hypothetical protein
MVYLPVVVDRGAPEAPARPLRSRFLGRLGPVKDTGRALLCGEVPVSSTLTALSAASEIESDHHRGRLDRS